MTRKVTVNISSYTPFQLIFPFKSCFASCENIEIQPDVQKLLDPNACDSVTHSPFIISTKNNSSLHGVDICMHGVNKCSNPKPAKHFASSVARQSSATRSQIALAAPSGKNRRHFRTRVM